MKVPRPTLIRREPNHTRDATPQRSTRIPAARSSTQRRAVGTIGEAIAELRTRSRPTPAHSFFTAITVRI